MQVINFFRHSDRIFALITIVISAIMFVLIDGMDEPYSPGAMAASTYPRIILCCNIFVSCLLILKPTGTLAGTIPILNRGIFSIVLVTIYILLLEKIGFFILTPIFLFIFPIMLGFRRFPLIFLSIIFVTSALYGIFVAILNIPLPQGFFGG